MLILTIRTDKPEAEVGLYQDSTQLAYVIWPAHRQLAETLHGKIRGLLRDQNHGLHDVQAIACYRGPGSFTGLRIGLSVGNALAYALQVPIAAESEENWRQTAITRLIAGSSDAIALPEYGAEVHITPPKVYPQP